MYNIIGDIAGRYKELMFLLDKMPKDNKIILVGDLVDRGPNSKDVVEWAINNPNVITLKGNHEDMMVDAFYGYPYDHHRNGGVATAKSYSINYYSDYPQSHINWMINLPLCFKSDELFVSHAPWYFKDELGMYQDKTEVLWNRQDPIKRDRVFQVFGHNHIMKKYDDYAICIDDCGNRKLTGMVWPNKEIYQVDYE